MKSGRYGMRWFVLGLLVAALEAGVVVVFAESPAVCPFHYTIF